MPTLELPSGCLINPLYVRSVSKRSHFWGDKYYLTLNMRGQADIEIEKLNLAQADKLMQRIQLSIDDALSSSTAYDDAYDAGQNDGFSEGRSNGYSKGYQEAKDAFWSHEREEYRINEYQLGYESGKRDGIDEGESSGREWGYMSGRDQMEENVGDALTDGKTEVLEKIMQKYPIETSFSFQQIEMALDWFSRIVRRRMQGG
jgi:flagellar biosynthesis/type III secretory pathway protein FliH